VTSLLAGSEVASLVVAEAERFRLTGPDSTDHLRPFAGAGAGPGEVTPKQLKTLKRVRRAKRR